MRFIVRPAFVLGGLMALMMPGVGSLLLIHVFPLVRRTGGLSIICALATNLVFGHWLGTRIVTTPAPLPPVGDTLAHIDGAVFGQNAPDLFRFFTAGFDRDHDVAPSNAFGLVGSFAFRHSGLG